MEDNVLSTFFCCKALSRQRQDVFQLNPEGKKSNQYIESEL